MHRPTVHQATFPPRNPGAPATRARHHIQEMTLATARLLALLVGLGLVACGEGDSSPAREIAFVEYPLDADAPEGLARIRDDGTGYTRLVSGTTESFRFRALLPSPNGRTLLYQTTIQFGGEEQWFTVPATGGTPRALATPPTGRVPEWAPDGSALAWLTYAGEIGVAPLGSATLSLLTPADVVAGYPTWSPDGSALVFAGTTAASPGVKRLFIVSVTGDLQPLLTSENNISPAWSPDGDLIAFIHAGPLDDPDNGVWLVAPDGTGARLLSPGWYGGGLFWNPAGTRLAVGQVNVGAPYVMLIDRATGEVTQSFRIATSNGLGERQDPWAPDGSRFLYFAINPTTFRPTFRSISLDGTEVFQVLPDSLSGVLPVWVP